MRVNYTDSADASNPVLLCRPTLTPNEFIIPPACHSGHEGNEFVSLSGRRLSAWPNEMK